MPMPCPYPWPTSTTLVLVAVAAATCVDMRVSGAPTMSVEDSTVAPARQPRRDRAGRRWGERMPAWTPITRCTLPLPDHNAGETGVSAGTGTLHARARRPGHPLAGQP